MKQPTLSSSATILLKTPALKYYDKGFITKYDNYTQVQIFSAGISILNLKLYEDKVCSDTFSCLDNKSFNKQYLHKSYEGPFLKKLFEKEDKNIVFRDRENRILIKVKRD